MSLIPGLRDTGRERDGAGGDWERRRRVWVGRVALFLCWGQSDKRERFVLGLIDPESRSGFKFGRDLSVCIDLLRYKFSLQSMSRDFLWLPTARYITP